MLDASERAMHAHHRRAAQREAFWSRVIEAIFSVLAILVLMAILALSGCGLREAAPLQPAGRNTPISTPEALQFLAQAAVGPRDRIDVEAVQAKGFAAWLDTQFQRPPVSYTQAISRRLASAQAGETAADMVYETVWQHWTNGNDRLRARTAYALSQIVALDAMASALPPDAFASYMDLLNRHAFGNYRRLLEEALLHPAMRHCPGRAARAGSPAERSRQCARLVWQQWVAGTVLLQADGTPRTDESGRPLPALDETDIENLAAVFAAPAAAEGAVAAAVDRLVRHPNAAPFLAQRLIAQFVTDTPSPAYVGRVAAAFANSGTGVRGDMQAVIRAILLDPEAREQTAPPARLAATVIRR
jgi:uncharacterized protein (DUF1800 family)